MLIYMFNRIPKKEEEKWILKHCRKEKDENVDYRPDLYEDWFHEEKESSSDDEMSKTLKMYSQTENIVASASSTPRLSQQPIAFSEQILEQKLDSSDLKTTSDVNWMKPTSSTSVDKDILDMDNMSE